MCVHFSFIFGSSFFGCLFFFFFARRRGIPATAMSMHDFGLLPPTHDHFPSAFMQGYHHHHPSSYDQYDISSSTQLPRDSRDVRDAHHHTTTTHPRDPRDAHGHHHRATTFMSRQQQQSYPHAFEYTHNPIAHSTLLPRAASGLDFDPRPPHAGWTPKEEVDDDEQSRELLTHDERSPIDVSMPHTRGSPRDLRDPRDVRDLSHSPSGQHPLPPSLAPAPLVAAAAAAATATSGGTSSKTYSFVSLPGNAVRKRPRRRYDEIERLYACSWPDCTKAYGTLNHLNAHVSMQRHGPKRSPAGECAHIHADAGLILLLEFKELRKQWRQQKKQDTAVISPATGARAPSSAAPSSVTRRRRATESALSLSLPGDMTTVMPAHRLSLGDLRYPPLSDDEGTALGPSPTSTTSDSVAYWQDSPISPESNQHHLGHHTQHQHPHQHQHQHHPHPRSTSLHYPVAIPQSPSLSPAVDGGAGGLSPPLNRLPPDSTLLTPLPGYRPPSPPSPLSPHQQSPMSRLGPGSTLLQPLHASTLATLSPQPVQDHLPRSPEMQSQRGYDMYQDRRSA